jgi:hypothetical protein
MAPQFACIMAQTCLQVVSHSSAEQRTYMHNMFTVGNIADTRLCAQRISPIRVEARIPDQVRVCVCAWAVLCVQAGFN